MKVIDLEVIDQIRRNKEDASNATHALASHTLHCILTSTIVVYKQKLDLQEVV